jgi:hypothetical protein
MKKAFPIVLMLIGLVFVGAGGYTIYRGVDAKHQVKDELVAQNITTTPDASIPNVQVKDAATAESMARIINHHSLDASSGKTYSQLGRYLAADGTTDTNDANAALKGADGKPVANPVRNTAFQASALETSLWSSVLAFNVADLVVGLGVMIVVLGLAVGGVGVALGGLVIPAMAKEFHVEPVAATHHTTATPA